MDLTCFLHRSWRLAIRPARAKRDWMDAAPESFAYRCLPLNIANAHGWEILNPTTFDACWNGRSDTDGVIIRPEAPVEAPAVSLFGQGVLTFHIQGLFRTSPSWNLWISGSPNEPKDGIYPLTGVVETDWSPFTFTMNWKFTRPDHWVRFQAGEPICFVFPVQRALLEQIAPVLTPLDEAPDLARRFEAWSQERDKFVERMSVEPPSNPAEKWQKHYYQGVDTSGNRHIEDHCTRLRLRPFDSSRIPWPLPPPVADVESDRSIKQGEKNASPMAGKLPPKSSSRHLLDLKKRDWLLDSLEQQRALSPHYAIERRAGMTREEFLERYYSANRPVILTGEMADWPALAKWTPDYLKNAIGSEVIEFQGDRNKSGQFEIQKNAHARHLPFNDFIDLATRPGTGNDVYLTAYNSARNANALAKLHSDLGSLDKFLSRDASHQNGMMWIGPADTFTPLHHDLTNNLIAQVVGRKRLLILPPSETGKLYNHMHVFSDISDLEDRSLTPAQFPLLEHARFSEVTLMPGEIIFMPLAWWHQVRSVDFSVTVTFTNFLWPNDAYKRFPAD